MSNENQNNRNTGPTPNEAAGAAASAKAADSARDLKESLRQMLRDGNDFNDIIKDQVRELGKLLTGYNKVRTSIDGFRTSSLDIKRIQQDINKTKSQEFIQSSKILETELKLKIAGERQLNGAQEYLGLLSDKDKLENQLRQAAIKGDRSRIDLLKQSLNLVEERIAAESQELTPLQGEYIARLKSKEVLSATTKELEEQLAKEKEIKSSIGLTGIAFENFSKKLGFGDSVYEAMIDKARKIQAQNELNAQKEELIQRNKRISAINAQREAQGKEPIPLFEIPETDGFFSRIKTKFADVKSSINDKGLFTSISDGLKDSAQSFGTSLIEGVKGVPKKISEGFNSAFNSLKAAPGKLLANFKVFGAGLSAMFKGSLESLKDPAVLALIATKISKSLMNIFSGATKMLSDGMKSIGGELAEGPIQNLTKPISGLLEKIPLVGGLLGGVVDLMATFMDYATNANSQFVKMGRELGLTADESQKLANNFSNYANSTNDVFLNSKKLYEAQIGLSKQLGTTAILSNEILSTNIRLKDVLGLEEDIQANIAQTSVITGKESQNIVGNVIAQVNNLKKAGLATQDYKAVLKEVSNLGGYLGLTFAKYPEKLTKAVLQTKAMGLELKQLDAIADSFLDYESSITKEMEAQVLTGKDINLNKAREAFLNNDLVKAAEEITKQVGSVDEFLKMDRIRAESLAAAFGMSRDTLADMLKKQTFLGKIGAKGNENAQQQYELAKKTFGTMSDITNEQEKQQYQALASGAANERLAALIEKIKQGFTDLISNSGVSEFIDKAIDFMSNPSKIQGFVNGLKDFFATVLEGIGTFVNGAAKIANVFLFGKDEIAEDYGDSIKGFAQNFRGGSLTKLDEGGVVQTSGIAEVHSGETYLGANSLQVIKMTAENSRKTVELLAKIATQKSDTGNSQVKFVTGNVVLDGVPTGKLMLNSFENNSYTNFDTTRYNS